MNGIWSWQKPGHDDMVIAPALAGWVGLCAQEISGLGATQGDLLDLAAVMPLIPKEMVGSRGTVPIIVLVGVWGSGVLLDEYLGLLVNPPVPNEPAIGVARRGMLPDCRTIAVTSRRSGLYGEGRLKLGCERI